MGKKIIGIFVCLLFLFSILPSVQGIDLEENKENGPHPSANHLLIIRGRIEFHGKEDRIIEFHDEDLYGKLGVCYNVTPIHVRLIDIVGSNGIWFSTIPVYDDPYYLPKDIYKIHFVTQHYIFLIGWYDDTFDPDL
jgi:hypothetical protein